MVRIGRSQLIKLQKSFKTDALIGKQFAITRQAVYQRRKKYGIESLFARLAERNRQIVGEYKKGVSADALARSDRYLVISKATDFYRLLVSYVFSFFIGRLRPLLVACPLGRSKPNCPFSQARALSCDESEAWLTALQPSAITHIVRHHLNCPGVTAT